MGNGDPTLLIPPPPSLRTSARPALAEVRGRVPRRVPYWVSGTLELVAAFIGSVLFATVLAGLFIGWAFVPG